MAGDDDGLLTGLPLSIKDLTAVKGVRFTSGSRTLADFIAPRRLAGLRAREGAWRGDHRQDHHHRVRLQGVERQPAHRRHPQSLESGQDHGRLLRRRRRERRRRHHAVRARHRRRRLDPHSVLVLRSVRHQGAVRPRPGLSGRGDADARPCRADGAHRARRGAAAHRHFRLRCARSGERRRRRAGLSRRLRAIAEGPADRLEPDARLRPSDAGGGRDRRQGGARVRGARLHGRAGREGLRRSDRAVDGRVLCRRRHAAQEAARRAPRHHRPGGGRRARKRARSDHRRILRARFRALRVPREGAAVLRALRSADDADHADAGLRPRPRCSDRARRREHRRLGRLHLSVQSVRLAGRVGALRIHAGRSAGRPAHRVEGAARDRHPARGRGLRGGAAMGGQETAARAAAPRAARGRRTGTTASRDDVKRMLRARWRLR